MNEYSPKWQHEHHIVGPEGDYRVVLEHGFKPKTEDVEFRTSILIGPGTDNGDYLSETKLRKAAAILRTNPTVLAFTDLKFLKECLHPRMVASFAAVTPETEIYVEQPLFFEPPYKGGDEEWNIFGQEPFASWIRRIVEEFNTQYSRVSISEASVAQLLVYLGGRTVGVTDFSRSWGDVSVEQEIAFFRPLQAYMDRKVAGEHDLASIVGARKGWEDKKKPRGLLKLIVEKDNYPGWLNYLVKWIHLLRVDGGPVRELNLGPDWIESYNYWLFREVDRRISRIER